MYLRILKKDLKRKKTMNVILLIFVILAATFIASSANNLITVSGAMDNFFEKANVPDYWFSSTLRLVQIEPKNVTVEGEKMEYKNTICLSTLGGINIFDKNDDVITHINDGEIYVAGYMFHSTENDYHEAGR